MDEAEVVSKLLTFIENKNAVEEANCAILSLPY